MYIFDNKWKKNVRVLCRIVGNFIEYYLIARKTEIVAKKKGLIPLTKIKITQIWAQK